MATKPWVCMDCGVYFYPNPPEFECPKCGGKSRPSIMFDSTKHEIYEKHKILTPKEQKCPNCSTVMVPGIITEAAENLMGLYHHDSVRWTAHGPRYIFPPLNSVFPTAYACPKCGKIELYIKLLDDPEKPKEEKITIWVDKFDLIGYCFNCKTEYDFYKHGYFCPTCKKKNTEKRNKEIQ